MLVHFEQVGRLVLYGAVFFYSNDNIIVIETQEGVNISIFNMQGLCLYSSVTLNSMTLVDNIKENMVIVVVDNVAYKLLLR